MKKLLCIVLTLAFCLSGNLMNVSAITSDERIVNYNGEQVSLSTIKPILCQSDISKVIYKEPLTVDGVSIELYCEFDNNQEAVIELMEVYETAFDYLYDNYDLPTTITENNYEEFQTAIFSTLQDGIFTNDIATQFDKILSFFDIYENSQLNAEIKELADSIMYEPLSRNSFVKEELKLQIDELIPDYSENFGTIVPVTNSRVGASLNVEKATEYATEHATSPNYFNYYVFSQDCTNFVSQILEYSGVSQVTSSSEYSGWWHKVSALGGHSHSRSWTVADTFARYMGVTVSTTDIYTWSEGLREGDFISYDKANDGAWDHMGYVTDTSGVLKTHTWEGDNYSGLVSYYNFRVAQHTTNYHAWASGDTNNWEKLVENGARFGRIRG